MQVTIKVPKHLPTYLVARRNKRCTYETNRHCKAYGLYLLLKTQTTSGVIDGIDGQLKHILKLTKLSRATFYRHLDWAASFGLVKRQRTRLVLSSYSFVAEETGAAHDQFIEVEYDSKAEARIEDILKALEYSEASALMKIGLKATIRKTPAIGQAFKMQSAIMGKQGQEFNPANLMDAQMNAFRNGGAADVYQMLFKANPDINRSIEGIAKARFMKNPSSAFYERNKLGKVGLLKLEPRDPVVCNYIKSNEKLEKGKCENRQRQYNQKLKQAIWFLPVAVTTTLNAK